jgi:ATP-binding cassette subfamily F protein uup
VAAPGRNLINLESVSKAYGDRPLLDGVSNGVGVGERIGVVGRNGAGKTTLLSVMAGTETVDIGRVATVSGARIGFLRQNPVVEPGTTILQAVLGSAATHEWAGEPRVREVLGELLGGFDDELLDRRTGR